MCFWIIVMAVSPVFFPLSDSKDYDPKSKLSTKKTVTIIL
jgi:hypothetical protein